MSVHVVVGPILFLAGCWVSAPPWLPAGGRRGGVSLSSRPHRPPCRAAPGMAAGEPEIEANLFIA